MTSKIINLNILAYCISNYLGQPVEPSEFFYTHSDHLGSASWITDRHAEPVQYIHYAPYGELLANQTPYGYDERYKFTGKERDAESGYDYFGARFLAQQLGIWITPDPLLDKYIFTSPYMYCNGNPVKYVDPDGREKHNKMDPDAENVDQCYLWEGANQLPDPGNTYICFFAHGNQNAMYPHGCEQPMYAEDFIAYLSENSDVWKSTKDKSSLIIVLISCETGKGDNPIAKKISELIPDVTVMAPTEEIRAFGQGDLTAIGGSGKSGAKTVKELGDPKYSGQWNYYKNGALIDTSKDGYMYQIYRQQPKDENNSIEEGVK